MKDSVRNLLRRRNLAIMAVALVVWKHDVILGTLFDQIPGFAYRFDDRKFDAKTWRAGEPEMGKCTFGRMTDDLIENHLKPGTSRAQVEALIGTTMSLESYGYFDPKSPKAADIVVQYPLGSCSGFQMDGDILAIQYDRSNRIVAAWHYQT